MDPRTQNAEAVIARISKYAADLSEDRDRLRAINAELLAAAKRVRARCQSMNMDVDAAAALGALSAAITRAEGTDR